MTTAFDFGKLFILHSTNLKISQAKPLQLLHVLQVTAPSPVSTAPDRASSSSDALKNDITPSSLNARLRVVGFCSWNPPRVELS